MHDQKDKGGVPEAQPEYMREQHALSKYEFPSTPDRTLPENRFINRELSWLAFNERVLEEAANDAHPLFERVRFLSISDNNLNEFFAVRVAGLKNQVRARISERSADGPSATQQLEAVNRRAADLMNEQQSSWLKLRKLLSKQGIEVVGPGGLRDTDRKWLTAFFTEQIYSVLTPVAIDPAHPFPFIPNFGFTIALMMEREDGSDPMFGLISIPQGLPRFVRLPGRKVRYITMEAVISMFLDRLFPGIKVHAHGVFQIIRDSDIEVE
jgi:polyphosphate kinase